MKPTKQKQPTTTARQAQPATKGRALITGGAGFIGSSVERYLTQLGFAVTLFDNLSFGRSHHILPSSQWIKGDLRQESDLKALGQKSYDLVFHLAALHFIPYCNAHPVDTIDVNIKGMHMLLQALAANPPCRLFFASTAAVYGINDKPHREKELPAPMDIYGLSKLSGEHLVRLFAKEHEVSVTIGRLFNAYGPRETNDHLIPHIVSQIKTQWQQPTIHLQLGNLKPYRDYVYVEDMAQVIVDLTLGQSRNLVLSNIGSGQEHSVLEVVDTCSKLLQRPIEVESSATLRRKAERMHLRPCMNQLKHCLPQPTFRSLEHGLKALLHHEGLLPSCES